MGIACPPDVFDWYSWATWSCLREDLAPVLTFIGAAIVAVAAWRQATIARRRHEEQTNADRERRITESFAKGVEQLGSDKLTPCLGGIYTLERLSRESEREYWPIMETLTAYVRETAPWPPRQAALHSSAQLQGGGTVESAAGSPSSDEPADQEKEPEAGSERIWPETHIQAILTVLGRREEGTCNQKHLNLSATDLRGANLKGAHFEGAILREAHLDRANLKEAHLDRADFWGACLRGANLKGAHLKCAILQTACLRGANLSGAHLEHADFGLAHLEYAIFHGAHLEGANFWGAPLDGTKLHGACLKGAEGLNQDQIERAFGDELTTLPKGLKRPEHWTRHRS